MVELVHTCGNLNAGVGGGGRHVQGGGFNTQANDKYTNQVSYTRFFARVHIKGHAGPKADSSGRWRAQGTGEEGHSGQRFMTGVLRLHAKHLI